MAWMGLGKRLRELFQPREIDGTFFEELEDALIEADIGVRFAAEAIEALKESARTQGITTRDGLRSGLKAILASHIVSSDIALVPDALNVLVVLGVNGVGKTTTIAKLARHFRANRGIERILLVAGDTFRAAAIDQLKVLGKRLDLPVVAQEPGADPGAVIFDGITSATARGIPLVIADTAGRLHTKDALVKELGKIDKIVRSRVGAAGYQKLLVLDATTGQNSLAQAEVFHKAVGIDSIVLTKVDSTAKGGMVVPICRELG
ncbi:MAG TPA: signal recognition particle receptor subunit alpha, partial [Spirochaetia bacterium]|nr:signal recognition particle receptor subunit alpha [Spirochaetia bacterium]